MSEITQSLWKLCEIHKLWYLQDDDECVIVEDAIVDEVNQRFVIYIDYFSEYYFPRR